jgi:hypothetical protein
VLSKSSVSLPAGQHVLRLVMDTGGSWGYLGTIDYLAFEREQTPYGGTPWPVPGVIQVENFDNGSEGLAYHDTTATNDGGYYRAESVDIVLKFSVDIGGYLGQINFTWTDNSSNETGFKIERKRGMFTPRPQHRTLAKIQRALTATPSVGRTYWPAAIN